MRMYICMRLKIPKLPLKSSMGKILSIAIRKERLWKKLNKQLRIAPEFYNTYGMKNFDDIEFIL